MAMHNYATILALRHSAHSCRLRQCMTHGLNIPPAAIAPKLRRKRSPSAQVLRELLEAASRQNMQSVTVKYVLRARRYAYVTYSGVDLHGRVALAS